MNIEIDTKNNSLILDTEEMTYRAAEVELTKIFKGDHWKEYTIKMATKTVDFGHYSRLGGLGGLQQTHYGTSGTINSDSNILSNPGMSYSMDSSGNVTFTGVSDKK